MSIEKSLVIVSLPTEENECVGYAAFQFCVSSESVVALFIKLLARCHFDYMAILIYYITS